MTVLLGLAILPIAVAYIYFIARSVRLGWISILAVMLYDFTFGSGLIAVGGLNLSVVDVMQICLFVAGIIRTIPRIRERNTGRMIATAYLAIFALSLARGSATNGFAHAARYSSLFIAFLNACLYFLTAPADAKSVRTYLNIYFVYGVALSFVALIATAGFDVGAVAWAHHDPVQIAGLQGRVLPASGALSICFCFFLTLAESRYRITTMWFKWLPALFLALAVFLRHRTVWAVLVAGIASLFVVDRGLIRRVIPMAVAAIFFAAVYALLSGSIQKTMAQMSNSSGDEDSWLFRVAMWQSLLGGEQTVPGVLLGKDLGGGYMRYNPMMQQYMDVVPHNEYVTQYLSVGIVGVVLVLSFTIYPLKRFWRLCHANMRGVEPSASAWVAIIIGIIVFSIPYQPEADAYALLGIANAIVLGLKGEGKSPEIAAGS